MVDRHTPGGSQPIEQCRDSDIDTTTSFLAHFQVGFQEADWITVGCVCCVVSGLWTQLTIGDDRQFVSGVLAVGLFW